MSRVHFKVFGNRGNSEAFAGKDVTFLLEVRMEVFVVSSPSSLHL